MMSKIKKSDEKFKAFMTDVALAMKKHSVTDMVCIFGMDGKIRNTYLPLNGEMDLYCNISDGVNTWLIQTQKFFQ